MIFDIRSLCETKRHKLGDVVIVKLKIILLKKKVSCIFVFNFCFLIVEEVKNLRNLDP